MTALDPDWRTSTVTALCRRMLDTGVFDALPILADALEDGGCTDAAFLTACRADPPGPVAARRLVNLAYSAETEAAVRRLERLADRLTEYLFGEDSSPEYTYTYTYADLVEVGQEAIADGGYCFNSPSGPNHLGGVYRQKFFRDWALVTGNTYPGDDAVIDGIYFRCAC